MTDVLRSIVAAAYRSLGEAGLVLGAEGNVSIADAAGDVLLVTATGLIAADASAEGIATVGLQDGALRSGPEPTSELGTHLALARRGHAAIVHTHAPYATALGLVADEVPAVLAEQAIRVGGAVPVIPYVPTGTPEMAIAIAAALAGAVRAVVIRNHGVFAVGPDIRAALAAALATEEAARAYLLARAIGEPARVPSLEVARLRTLGGLTGV